MKPLDIPRLSRSGNLLNLIFSKNSRTSRTKLFLGKQPKASFPWKEMTIERYTEIAAQENLFPNLDVVVDADGFVYLI